MPKFGVLLNSLATKAGVKVDDDFLKKLLSHAEISNMDVPDEFSQALEANLLTVDSAAANTNVRGKLFAEALNGADSELDKSLDNFEFDDAFKGEWKTIQKNTNEKVRRLTTALKSKMDAIKADAAKGKATDPNAKVEVDSLKNQIAGLNQSLEQAKLLHQTEIENLRTQNLNDRKDFTLQSTLSGKPLPKNGLPQEINILTAKTLITQEMAKNGLIVTFDGNGQPLLKQRKDGAEIDFYVNNKQVGYADFIDGALAQNKFIQINDPNPNPGGGGNSNPGGGGQRTPAGTTQAVSAIDAQLAQLGATV
jgi:hypothetical protein